MSRSLRAHVHRILEPSTQDDTASRLFDIAIIVLIVMNVLAVILETVPEVQASYGALLRWFEWAPIAIFTVEYLLRIWSCTASMQFHGPVWGRLRFMFSPYALIDLLAILPFYLPFVFIDLRFLRAIRLLRIFRLLKIARYSESLKTFGRVFAVKKEELFIHLFMVGILMILASSLMYYIEHETQPEAFSSIPAAMWWAVAALTTVGYGDVYPVTALGKFLGMLIAILGIGLFAVPAGILGSGFVEEIQKKVKVAEKTCPHCGKELSD